MRSSEEVIRDAFKQHERGMSRLEAVVPDADWVAKVALGALLEAGYEVVRRPLGARE